ncbi:MAG: histidine-type phosphatase [Lachnospiraceae bacterium]|nr:histidine-type phosphatase [Lachnospiraceae bacterium]
MDRRNKKFTGLMVSLVLIISVLFSGCTNCSNEATALPNSLGHEGYYLEQVIVLSRHNIRSPLSNNGSVLGSITPHEWFDWTSNPSELSLRGGILETEMGQFFRRWMEEEGLIPENYHPTTDEVRICANSMQRTIATAQYFSSGLLPSANPQVEYNSKYDTMDPLFNPVLTFCSPDYALDAETQIWETFNDKVNSLEGNYELISKIIDLKDSDLYKNGEVSSFETGDCKIILENGKEPGMTGSLRIACSVSDALVLQYYEEKDEKKAAFGHDLSRADWEEIGEIKDVYGDVLFSAPLIAINVANPLLEEMRSEMGRKGRRFTFLCGHDSNVASVLAALGVQDYELPHTIEKKTPIGSKLVLSKWRNKKGEKFWSADLVYQTTDQLREVSLLDVNNPPAIYHLTFKEIKENADGLCMEDDFIKLFDKKIKEYDNLYYKYMENAA